MGRSTRPKRSRLVLPLKEYQALLLEVMGRDGWKCRVCKRRNGLHAHHCVYRSHGGDDTKQNLLTVCNECHDRVHKPGPNMKQLVILPADGDGEVINCDHKVKFHRLGGWK